MFSQSCPTGALSIEPPIKVDTSSSTNSRTFSLCSNGINGALSVNWLNYDLFFKTRNFFISPLVFDWSQTILLWLSKLFPCSNLSFNWDINQSQAELEPFKKLRQSLQFQTLVFSLHMAQWRFLQIGDWLQLPQVTKSDEFSRLIGMLHTWHLILDCSMVFLLLILL